MKPDMIVIIATYLLCINAVAFAFFGIDKMKAQRGAWRVREKTLFILAGLGGSLGALLGMFTFHHKTRKLSFQIGIPVILLVHTAIIVIVNSIS